MRRLVCLLVSLVDVSLVALPDAVADTCKVLTVPVPEKLQTVSRHDAKVPDIEFGEALDPFFDKLARVARGTAGVTLRIGIYGDSNWTNDRTSGDIRRRLQLAFGDAGHGWVAFGIPWGWYHHQNLQHGVTGQWSAWNLSAMTIRDGLYGFAGVSAESSQVGATAWVETAKTGEPVGTAVSTIEVWYLARPKGGWFEVLIDNESKEIVETESADKAMKYLRYKVTDGSHRLTIKVKKGSVRLFGANFERDTTGIVVDGIGMNALNALSATRMNTAQVTEGLKHRGYDLVLETTGTNVWSPTEHPKLQDEWIALFKSALPKASIMLWSAPDLIANGQTTSVFFMKTFSKWKHEFAKTNALGFWDQYEALGGYGSMPKWTKEQWAEPDGVHFGPRLNGYIGERFVQVVIKELARRLEKDPKLGCGSVR